jgi:hypothetical protein
MIPVVYTMVLIMYVMPFIGTGPIYAKMMDDFFLNSCQSYWWTNLILINNFYPWDNDFSCGAHLPMIANEFWMIVVLIPLISYFYNNFNNKRKVLYLVFSLIGLISMAAVLTITIKLNVVAYPGFLNLAFSNMYTKVYFRIPPFLIGAALSVFHFEYKYVDKLKDGS